MIHSIFLSAILVSHSTVNNAGYVLGTERIGKISSADMEGMFDTNVFGLINMTQEFIGGVSPRS